MCATRRLVLFLISTKYHNNIPKGIRLTGWTLNQLKKTTKKPQKKQRDITPEIRKPELSFLYATCRLILFYISTNYHKTILRTIRLTERIRNITKGVNANSKQGSVVILYATRCLVLFYISTKYHQHILKPF